MVSKKSRSEVRVKTQDATVSAVLLKDRVWLCSEAIIICMLKLLTIQQSWRRPTTWMQQHTLESDCERYYDGCL